MLDIEKTEDLIGYLRRAGRIDSNETPRCQPLAGGVSNRTVWVERENGEAWVLKQALEKLRVPTEWLCSPERVHREALGMRWLSELAPPGSIPALLFEDRDTHLIAMEAVAHPHENWKTRLLRGEIDDESISQFGELLGAIHRNAWRLRDELRPRFADDAYFLHLRLNPYYRFSAEQVPEANSFVSALIDETLREKRTLTHGDYSPKNILVRENRLILLDHEVIHWGDPAFDVGFGMTHLLSKAHHLPRHRQAFTEAALTFWNTYSLAARDMLESAPGIEDRSVRHTLACLLARVAGRSLLEYLSDDERERQKNVVISMLTNSPTTMLDLIQRFSERIALCP